MRSAAVALFPGTYVALGTPYAATRRPHPAADASSGLARRRRLVARPAAPCAFIARALGTTRRGARDCRRCFIGMTAFSTFKHQPAAWPALRRPAARRSRRRRCTSAGRGARRTRVAPDGAGAARSSALRAGLVRPVVRLRAVRRLPDARRAARRATSSPSPATPAALGTLGARRRRLGRADPLRPDARRRRGSPTRWRRSARSPDGAAMLRPPTISTPRIAPTKRRFGDGHLGDAEHPRRHRGPERAAPGAPSTAGSASSARLSPAAILFGSVYFGWHYALDGYVSILGVLAIWRHRRHATGRRAQDRTGRDVRSGLTPPAFGA